MTWDADARGRRAHDRALAHRPRASSRRERIAIDDRGVTIDYATLAARATELAERAAARRVRPGRPDRHGVGQLQRPRRRVLRVRARRRRVRPAVVAADAARAGRRARRARRPRSCSSRTSTRRSPARRCAGSTIGAAGRRARHDRGRGIRAAARARRGVRATRARRRPAARHLHLGQRGGAEGRRADPRELLLEQPRARAGAAAHRRTTSCSRCCRSSTSPAGTASRCSRGGSARPSCSSARSSRPACCS